jgi:hypothetical protein
VAAETVKYKIDDQEFEFPQLDDLDMEEWEVVYDYAGLLLEDFAPVEDEKEETARRRRVNQPAFTRAMLHIAYRRANPDASLEEVREVALRSKLIRHMSALGENSGEDESAPLESTTKPEPSSPGTFVNSPDTESNGSTTSSDEPENQPEVIGTGV